MGNSSHDQPIPGEMPSFARKNRRMTIAEPIAGALGEAADGRENGATSISLRVGYGVGQLGVQILRDMPTTILPSYITLVLGLPAWVMSLVIFVPKIWIILADILFGTLSDRTDTRWGRRRPFLFIGAIIAPLALLLLFAGPRFSQPWMQVGYVMIAYTIASSAYSIFSVPYLSMGAELSSNTNERTKIMSVRMMFLAAGLIVGVGAAQPLIKFFGDGRGGYRAMAITMGIVCFASMMACFLGTRNVRSDRGVREKFSIGRQFAIIRSNKPFQLLASFHFIQLLAGASQSTVFLFAMIYMSGHPALLLLMTMANSSCVILVQYFWVRMSIRFSKKKVYLFAIIAWSIVCFSWFFVHTGSAAAFAVPGFGMLTVQDVGVVARYVLSGALNGGITLMSLSMLTDTVEHDRKLTGVGHEGVYSGAWSALEKIAFASGPLWVGPFLQAFGFVHSTTGAAAQSLSAIHGVGLAVAVIPAVLVFLTVPLALRYPDKTVED